MNVPAAIIAFSQSEKIKSGLIWITQALELLSGLSTTEQQGAEKVIKTIIDMISQEIHVARNLTKDDSLNDIEKHMDMALVMINSQMTPESGYHLIQALTRVTSLGQRSMSVLKEKGLL
ncbi:MAG: hypothetical protein ABIK98_06290 [Pseudomonadota bacterium]|uniref:Uncharacterized protein n=1 Tax=Candidatus Desulfatibia profunda TaxID=2841695 RepID=A0A8J6NXV2_9BACT|nr:hypothetical protein [Candidatus Desulfatibia profunda]MBL7181328.1 hypothetical protein [Desulfobacterales bacterium]MBU0699208.1 hypothetical protein [Pseudomonadota bacterium]